ncbi:5-oxoprolinase subunit C family protein [Marinobacter mobilis]|uniref:Biotin-dependent carboxylase uncharacterized domain-containing protein n=1 Tax=Marinobacter mobilis TaxID=488533 RepID=A0A1H2V7U2_9GAMM|nr:biotin-dependent carboxyltransferase family protein [Marinobacter mobilis]SDW64391.1 biotin-dependent carboxylase uncharacterized domain-containing protein [Marinobacter mobilis]
MNLLRVITPGPLTTVQDSGRKGYQKHGLAQGGAADRHAFLWANKLFDNGPDQACLELAFGGFEAEALCELTIAVTGAAQEILVNGTRHPGWRTVQLKTGDRLKIPGFRYGRISYLAISGGVLSESFLGSRSIVVREQIEGLGAVAAGDVIKGAQATAAPTRTVPEQFRRYYQSPVLCRVIPGYQYKDFSSADLNGLFRQKYRVSQRSDRMGFQLAGAPLTSPPPGITSEGIAMGAIQVPGDGNPIVLLNDRQTIGGYPKVGVVCSQDCNRLIQALPGNEVRFTLTNVETAQAEWQVFERFFQMSRWCASGDRLSWA